jgi:hypothetical protein
MVTARIESQGYLELNVLSQGGEAGDVEEGLGGIGGDSLVDISAVTGAGGLMVIDSGAGSGGDVTSPDTGTGGLGGNATATAEMELSELSVAPTAGVDVTVTAGTTGISAGNPGDLQGVEGGDASATGSITGLGTIDESAFVNTDSTAGDGSTGSGLTSVGGTGGDAQASSTVFAAGDVTNFADASAVSTGGDGGDGLNDAIGGDGGDAVADASVTSEGSGITTATAISTAGAGGLGDNGSMDGYGGDALATSSAMATNGGEAISTAEATGGLGDMVMVGDEAMFLDGSATATAEAFGDTGTATATATSGAEGDELMVRARAEGPVASTVVVEGKSSFGTVAEELSLDDAKQSFAYAIAMPDEAGYEDKILPGGTVETLMFSDPMLTDIIGQVLSGSVTPEDGTGIHTYSSQVDFSIDVSLIDDPLFAGIGFLDPVFLGDESDFVGLSLSVEREGQDFWSFSVGSLEDALFWFTDQVFGLGSWTEGVVGNLDLSIMMDVTLGTNPGQSGFGFEYLLGNSTEDLQPQPIPEPSTFILMAFGIGIALYLRRRKRVEA